MHIQTNAMIVRQKYYVFINVYMLYNAEKNIKEARLMPMDGRANGYLTLDLALGNKRGAVPHPSLLNI